MNDLLVQLILGGFGVSGIVGAGVALFKLRPDVQSSAVTNSETAMNSMAKLNDELEADRDRWKEEYDKIIPKYGAMQLELEECRESNRRLTRLLEGRRIQ